MNIPELKRLAKRDHLDWQELEKHAADLIAAETAAAANDHAIRKTVYRMTCPKGKEHLPFWKALGQWNNPRYNGAFGGGNDYTVIARWDEIAQELSWDFPELNQNSDPSRALYDLICSPPVRILTRHEALVTAMDQQTGQKLADILERQTEIPF